MKLRNQRLALASVLSIALFAAAAPAAFAQMGDMSGADPMVGGAALEGPGPFTVFAPTNEAFAMLPPGTVDTLVKPENKAMLTKILTYHVVAGRYTSADLMKMIQDGGGKAMLTTVQGEPLTVSGMGHHLTITDAKGDLAHITIMDVIQSNGVIDVIDTVLMPN